VLGIGRSPEEVKKLEALIANKIEAAQKDAADGAGGFKQRPDVVERRLEFVRLQFADPMRNYTRFGGWYSIAFTLLSLAALVSGLASSGIAAGWSEASWARWTILTLGIVAAAAAVVNQAWKPGQKSAARARGGNALRREAWEFLLERGPYIERGADEGFGLFADRVAAIVRASEEVDEEVPETKAFTVES
jgi:hypothetical protein